MKFSVGEIAVFWFPGDVDHGKECEIICVGPLAVGTLLNGPVRQGYSQSLLSSEDYEVRIDGIHWGCMAYMLRKRRPPIPDEVLTIFETRKRVETA